MTILIVELGFCYCNLGCMFNKSLEHHIGIHGNLRNIQRLTSLLMRIVIRTMILTNFHAHLS